MIMSENNKWNRRWLELCDSIASWSKDPSTKVGAFIVDSNNKPVSFGYNGFAQGVEDTELRLRDRELKYPLTIHAELNAIITAHRHLEGCVLYCTHSPCAACMSAIAQAGIKKVVTYVGD